MVLTLIAGARGRQSLPHLAGAVAGAAGITGEPTWLADDACDLVLDATSPTLAEAAARAVIGDAEIDVLVQPAANRRKRLLVADMESTIIENEMLDELADFIGLRQEVSEITRRAMNGEIDFTAALEARVGLLAGLPDHVLDEAAGRIRLRAGRAAADRDDASRRSGHGARFGRLYDLCRTRSPPNSGSITSSPTGSI